MKRIAYVRPDGGLSILTPAPWARLVSAITIDGDRSALAAPTPFDALVRVHKTEDLSPEWAESEDAFIERIRMKDVPADALDIRIVEQSDLPADRTFRNAWHITAGGGVEVHMDKARAIYRDRLRGLRKPLLAALDIDYIRALERAAPSSEIEAIVTAKQALRDITQDAAIDAAKTPDDLSAHETAITYV